METVSTTLKDELREPLPQGYAIWMFCLNCKTKTPLSLVQIKIIINSYLKSKLGNNNIDFSGMYLEAATCHSCSKKADVPNATFKLKEI